MGPGSRKHCFGMDADFWTGTADQEVHRMAIEGIGRAGRKVGAGDRSRTYTALRPEDFESSASAIPPLRHFSAGGILTRLGAGEEVGLGRSWDGQQIPHAPLRGGSERLRTVNRGKSDGERSGEEKQVPPLRVGMTTFLVVDMLVAKIR